MSGYKRPDPVAPVRKKEAVRATIDASGPRFLTFTSDDGRRIEDVPFDRLVDCVQALAGIEDPAAELARLREIERCADVLADDPGSLAKQDNLRAALGAK